MKKAMDRKSTTKTLLLMCMVRLGLGYKIRHSDCWINDTMDYMMHCTCGGIGDPFSIILNKVKLLEVETSLTTVHVGTKA